MILPTTFSHLNQLQVKVLIIKEYGDKDVKFTNKKQCSNLGFFLRNLKNFNFFLVLVKLQLLIHY